MGHDIIMKPITRSLTIFLLKSGRTGPDSLRAPAQLDKHNVTLDPKTIGTLYLRPSSVTPPRWLTFFSGALDFKDVSNAMTANASAVLFLSKSDRTFAVTFGYGRTLLVPGSWEEDFGLKATLNSVDPQKIRSVDRMSLDAIGQHSRIQASREANIGEFGLDLEQDLLRAVTGKPSDASLGKQLTGKDALQVTVAIEITSLPGLLDIYLKQSQSTAYKQQFPWIDQIHEVRDPLVVAKLDAALITRIKKADLARLWLTIPAVIDWEHIDGFRYRDAKSADTHPDVHFESFLQEVGGADEVSLELLKARHVNAVSAETEETIERWTVYRCIYCEVDDGKDTFLLNNGKWYKVGTQFLKRVNQAYEATPAATIKLPDYHDKSEGVYNSRVEEELPNEFALMDQKLIRCGDAYSKVEFCDLYSKSKIIVHVKRYGGSSAPLSHLFAQAVVSGNLFRRDADFRKNVNDLLPAAYRPVIDPPAPGEFEVVLGIVSTSPKKLVIPFFSRVNLKNARDRLEGLGYKVSLLKIQAPSK